jgi:hypothetical protein
VLSFPGCTFGRGGTENDVGVTPYGISKAVWPARRRDVLVWVLGERDGPREDKDCEMPWEKMGLENWEANFCRAIFKKGLENLGGRGG